MDPDFVANGLVPVRPYRDLENFANVECVGGLVSVYNVSSDTLTPYAVFVDGPQPLMEERFMLQACFNRFIEQRVQDKVGFIDVEDLPKEADAFKALCMKSE